MTPLNKERDAYRRAYLEAWQKAREGQPLQPVEEQIVAVVNDHPEYHPMLEQGDRVLERDWTPEQGETNPFLHMGLHIALHEQVTIDRPPGIRQRYQRMIDHCQGDVHTAEHRILDCLADEMWQAQRDQRAFQPDAYLTCITNLLGGDRTLD